MERFNLLIQDEVYESYVKKNEDSERDRIFCKHDRQHFLDVARICYILALEEGYPVSKEIIYTCAFLHDIGKWQQYTLKIPHEEASYKLARPLLDLYGFNEIEQEEILLGILGHRKGAEDGLGKLMYQSDKLSRRCHSCKAQKECDWSFQVRNMGITY